ncbi:contact-dependent growth inhibition system immunity protein [Kitasatospora sp. NPDC001603]|uniref:contact-dependent growth inhibition system immunity protein n=1 Tax=Kitasatospora sp. NPDC001603 TaxID=3154388 RepID=UPI003321FEDB
MNRDPSPTGLQPDREPDRENGRGPGLPVGATRLVATAHALRRKPVGELTVEDLRLLIRQDVRLLHLPPRALDVLRDDPMVAGDLYEGDLLHAVLTRSPDVWSRQPALGHRLRQILAESVGLPPPLRREAERFLARSCPASREPLGPRSATAPHAPAPDRHPGGGRATADEATAGPAPGNAQPSYGSSSARFGGRPSPEERPGSWRPTRYLADPAPGYPGTLSPRTAAAPRASAGGRRPRSGR